MSAWSTDLLDNDATQSAVHDLLESPNPADVIQEALALAEGEPEELDDNEIAAILASATVVDSVIYGTEHPSHTEGIDRLAEQLGASALAKFEAPLSKAIAKLLEGDALKSFFKDPPTAVEAINTAPARDKPKFKGFRKNVEALQQRLSPSFHGSQKLKS